ncbi:E3 ubiquitin-protein ligase TRIM35-like [Engraulis encrasicolus]|uniref:E3 ubiquitin-protein ligase TRIM35-like n=1 Tax=Engraulis encrasicolus TaxID=184585 RepID=UPI002FCF93D2
MVCVECVSTLHPTHTFISISKSADQRRDSIRARLRALADKLDIDQIRCVEAITHIKAQSERTEGQIKQEFEELRRFLREEEEARIAALREEEQRKRSKMEDKKEEVEEAAVALARRAELIELAMGADDVTFLQNFKDLTLRVTSSVPDHSMSVGALLDVVKHLGNLRYRVWQHMSKISPYFPVLLDPNTAHRFLQLSEDLTQVWDNGTRADLPDNPERFWEYEEILGSEDFRSGTHCWDVAVGGVELWIVGVATESCDRKRKCRTVPEEGFWVIHHRDGRYSALTSSSVTKPVYTQTPNHTHQNPLQTLQTLPHTPQTPLHTPQTQIHAPQTQRHTQQSSNNTARNALGTAPRLQQIRVKLDLDAGHVTFTDPDSNAHIHTYTHTFTEKVYPYFYTQSQQPLKILPVHVNVSVSEIA